MSDTKIAELVTTLLDGIQGITKSETILGEPQPAGRATIIPVHRLRVAFGAASASAGAHGARVGGDTGAHGAAGAVELDPIAAIAVTEDGRAHLLPVESDAGGVWSSLLADAPDLVSKIVHTLSDRLSHELETRVSPKPSAALPPKPSGGPEGS